MIDKNDDQDYDMIAPDLDQWFAEGIKHGATHMFVVSDGSASDKGPLYVVPPMSIERGESLSCTCGHILEFYDLSIPRKDQHGKWYGYEQYE